MNKRHALLLVGTAFALLELSSCAALMRYKCNREYAAKKGMDDAENGRTSMPGRLEGATCDSGGDYAASDFSKDYNYGYGKKKDEVCQPATASAWGRSDGEAGNENRPSKTKLRLCDDRGLDRLSGIYEGEFKKSYCAPARAQKLGKDRAGAWQPADFETAFNFCKTNLKALRAAYMGAYRDTMNDACTVGQAEKSAQGEAAARRGPESVRERLAHCTVKNKDEVLAAFDRTYQTARNQIALQDAQAAAAQAAAARQAKVDEFMRNTATATFVFAMRTYVSHCSVASDRSYVTIEVENNYPDQILFQGNWKVSYYGNDFNKITEDRDQDAVLIGGNSRKAFQKMTLPRDAAYCRAEFLGNGN